MQYSHIRLPQNIGTHFYGWRFVINEFKKQTKLISGAPVFDAWVDSFFDTRGQSILLKNNKWVGVLHGIASNVRKNYLDNFFASDIYSQSKDNCLLLLTTSSHTRDYCLEKVDKPVKTLLFPKPDTGHRFNLDAYLNYPQLRHSGFFGRNIKKFISFSSSIQKIIYSDNLYRTKQYLNHLSDNQSIIFHSKWLKPHEYIDKFTSSIGYSFYDDCSASTSILEHIVTHTPVLVNKIPPIVEYLGEDYPMYLNDLPDNLDYLLLDKFFLQEVSSYLCERAKKKEFTVDYFIKFLNNLQI